MTRVETELTGLSCFPFIAVKSLEFSLITVEITVRAFFFFQAEDGIRDYKVTGVQTCALPISVPELRRIEIERCHQRRCGAVPAGGAGARQGSKGPLPANWPRTPRPQMEPSRIGAAGACRVVPRSLARPRAARRARALDRLRRLPASDLLEAFVEPARVRLFRLGERLEPLRELGEAFLPRGLGHARVHLGVLVRLAGDRGPEVLLGLADRLVPDRIADLFQEVEVPEGVAGLGVRRVLEEARHVGGPLDVGDARAGEGAPGRPRLAGARLLQGRVTLGAPAAPARHDSAPPFPVTGDRPPGRRHAPHRP